MVFFFFSFLHTHQSVGFVFNSPAVLWKSHGNMKEELKQARGARAWRSPHVNLKTVCFVLFSLIWQLLVATAYVDGFWGGGTWGESLLKQNSNIVSWKKLTLGDHIVF